MKQLLRILLLLIIGQTTQAQTFNCKTLSQKEGKIEYTIRVDSNSLESISLSHELVYHFWDYGCNERYAGSYLGDSIAFIETIDTEMNTYTFFYKKSKTVIEHLPVFLYLKAHLNDKEKISIVPLKKSTIPKKKRKYPKMEVQYSYVEFHYDDFEWGGRIYIYDGLILKATLKQRLKVGNNAVQTIKTVHVNRTLVDIKEKK